MGLNPLRGHKINLMDFNHHLKKLEWKGMNQVTLHTVSIVLVNFGFSGVCVPICNVRCIFFTVDHKITIQKSSCLSTIWHALCATWKAYSMQYLSVSPTNSNLLSKMLLVL